MTPAERLMQSRLPDGVQSRFVDNGNGLRMHALCAGDDSPDRPLVLLLHGFPELAFSWRKIMLPLAQAGYFVVAPDQRGYGLTVETELGDGVAPVAYDTPLERYQLLNLARDAVGLVWALGRTEVALLVGHDFGSPVAGMTALVRPDVFKKLALMSAPYSGPPALPSPDVDPRRAFDPNDFALLDPPRKHYQWYYSTKSANADMMGSTDGLQAFLRDYYHAKSADWAGNAPHTLERSVQAMATMPHYYIMLASQTMPEAVISSRPTASQISACQWLPDEDLAVYTALYEATGFQGGLQWYRCNTSGQFTRQYQLFGGRRIEQPTCFIAGRADWGVYQIPGAIETMAEQICCDFRGNHLIEGAGHWVQQEQAGAVTERLLAFASAD